ncbi:hypothetical protein MASR2M15_17750 [Anaerolineales bacterium]
MISERHCWHYAVPQGSASLYLNAQDCKIRVTRWKKPEIMIEAVLTPAQAWRIKRDQDENGVYMVIHGRKLFKKFRQAALEIYIPEQSETVFKLDDCDLQLANLKGGFNMSQAEQGLILS